MPWTPGEPSRPELGTLVDLCRHRAAERPDRRTFVFLDNGVDESDSLTLGQLDLRARAIAARLGKYAPAGGRALLSYPPGLDFVSAFFGCLYAGIIAVPCPPIVRSPHDARHTRLRAIAESCEPELLLSDAGTLDKVDPLLHGMPYLSRLTPVATDEVDAADAERWSPCPIDPDTVAYLQYTSGTVQRPRGVVLTHGNVMHNLALIVANGSGERDDLANVPPAVSWLPVFHDMGLISNVVQPVFVGYDAVLMSPATFVRHPFNWLRAISDRRAGISAASSFGYELCVRRVSEQQRRSLDLSAWRMALIGADAVRAEVIDEFSAAFAPCGFRREAFFPSYGMAESTVMVSGGPVEREPVIERFDAAALAKGVARPAEPGAAARRLVGCGQVQPSLVAAVVDPVTGEPCAADEVGEILVSGPSIGKGYWNAPEASARTFRAVVPGHGGREFLRTGSLGFLNAGQLFVTCRVTDLIVLDGAQHYPQDIEATASGSHEAVRDGFCAALAVPDGAAERLVVLAEIASRYRALPDGAETAGEPPAGRGAVPAAELRRAIRDAVAAAHGLTVHDVVLLKTGSLPFTTSGKLRRAECRARYRAGDLTADAG
ncbi:fatty acyl-AMP ligase [Gandjariella thermophila]|uniref:Acyl-CoA synthetase n=1 Tax=Gandjariella thermophila TaxID=1931992 RepID=A0A4D4JEC5_9PSEU|nr:fatty acyl-AMP ligase [Gandjariella thermophila]GDY33390.1 acyl-CoA synthetase [Gandjariella thermophila]